MYKVQSPYRARGETLTFEECKNYRGAEAARKAGGFINQIKGFECWSRFSWKPLEGYVRKLSYDVLDLPFRKITGYVGEQGWWQGV